MISHTAARSRIKDDQATRLRHMLDHAGQLDDWTRLTLSNALARLTERDRTLVLTAPGTVVLGGGPTEWHDLA